jgi:hypothetical protein
MYVGNVYLQPSDVSEEDFRRIKDFVDGLSEEHRDMVAELQKMYSDVNYEEDNWEDDE